MEESRAREDGRAEGQAGPDARPRPEKPPVGDRWQPPASGDPGPRAIRGRVPANPRAHTGKLTTARRHDFHHPGCRTDGGGEAHAPDAATEARDAGGGMCAPGEGPR